MRAPTFGRNFLNEGRTLNPKIPAEVRQILHRVGLALIVFGLLDIGLMIYCIVNRLNYSSSVNVFAVICGIYLWRGHPWYVKWVTRAAGFYAGGFCTLVPIAPFFYPLDLGVLEMRLHPVGVIIGTVATAGTVAFLIWVYRELRKTPVLTAYVAAGSSPGSFWAAPVCGAALALGVCVLIFLTFLVDGQHRAIGLARAKTGPGYHYFVTHLSHAGDTGSAEVLAYDTRTIRTVEVEW